MTVTIIPLPAWARKTKYKPLPPPIFPGGAPTPAELALALELFDLLDDGSRSWYCAHFVERLRAKLPT